MVEDKSGTLIDEPYSGSYDYQKHISSTTPRNLLKRITGVKDLPGFNLASTVKQVKCYARTTFDGVNYQKDTRNKA